MAEGDIFDDLDVNKIVFIQKMNGKRLTLKWSKFKKLIMDILIRINNIDPDYIEILKRSWVLIQVINASLRSIYNIVFQDH